MSLATISFEQSSSWSLYQAAAVSRDQARSLVPSSAFAVHAFRVVPALPLNRNYTLANANGQHGWWPRVGNIDIFRQWPDH